MQGPMSIGTGNNRQGMISAANPLVDSDLTPTAVSLRFFHALFESIYNLEQKVGALQQRLGDPPL